MNYASLVSIQEERVFADQSVHHVPSHHFFAVDPNNSFSANRSVLKFNVEEFPPDRHDPTRDEVVLAVILFKGFGVIGDDDVHRERPCRNEGKITVASFRGLLCPPPVAIVFPNDAMNYSTTGFNRRGKSSTFNHSAVFHSAFASTKVLFSLKPAAWQKLS